MPSIYRCLHQRVSQPVHFDPTMITHALMQGVVLRQLYIYVAAHTGFLEDGPALLLPLVEHPGPSHLPQQLQPLGVRAERQLVDLGEGVLSQHGHIYTSQSCIIVRYALITPHWKVLWS